MNGGRAARALLLAARGPTGTGDPLSVHESAFWRRVAPVPASQPNLNRVNEPYHATPGPSPQSSGVAQAVPAGHYSVQ